MICVSVNLDLFMVSSPFWPFNMPENSNFCWYYFKGGLQIDMINRENLLLIAPQCWFLDLCRSTVYYKPVPLAERVLGILHRIEKFHLRFPFYGSRWIQDQLGEGVHGQPQEGLAPYASDGY